MVGGYLARQKQLYVRDYIIHKGSVNPKSTLDSHLLNPSLEHGTFVLRSVCCCTWLYSISCISCWWSFICSSIIWTMSFCIGVDGIMGTCGFECVCEISIDGDGGAHPVAGVVIGSGRTWFGLYVSLSLVQSVIVLVWSNTLPLEGASEYVSSSPWCPVFSGRGSNPALQCDSH